LRNPFCLENIDGQVLGKGCKILCLRDTDGQGQGYKREISWSLMARKQSFVWAYPKGDSPLWGSCTWLLPKHPETPHWQKKDKKGTNNHEVSFSDNKFLTKKRFPDYRFLMKRGF